jgi:Ca-activated chloride channel family protein
MNSIQSNFLPENHCWLQGTPKQHFYLYLEIEGQTAPSSNQRIPLNLSLVMDRSGSMVGEKIDFAKKAACFVIKNLGPRDCASVVQYDDVVEVVSPSARVSDKETLLQRIESISARNMTNLSGGMLAGYEQLALTKAEGMVNRVLLLSDGLANQGITQPEQLQQIAQDKFRELGLALSTFGVGADFDEKLMTNLSEYGGGNYYFIDSPDKIPAIFAKELEGLLAVVAQQVTLELDLPADFQCEQVFGYPAEIQGQSVRIRFNDVFSNEKKAVLVKLNARQAPAADFRFLNRLSYTDVLGGPRSVQQQQEIRVRVVADSREAEDGVVKMVSEQTTLFTANNLLEMAARLNESRQFEQAMELFGRAKQLVELQLKSSPNNEELRRLLSRILEMESQQVVYSDMSEMEQKIHVKSMREVAYLSSKKRGI